MFDLATQRRYAKELWDHLHEIDPECTAAMPGQKLQEPDNGYAAYTAISTMHDRGTLTADVLQRAIDMIDDCYFGGSTDKARKYFPSWLAALKQPTA